MNFWEVSGRSFVAISPVTWGFRLPLAKHADFLKCITLPKNLTVRKAFILAQTSKFCAKEWELKSHHSPPLCASLIQMRTFYKNKLICCVFKDSIFSNTQYFHGKAIQGLAESARKLQPGRKKRTDYETMVLQTNEWQGKTG